LEGREAADVSGAVPFVIELAWLAAAFVAALVGVVLPVGCAVCVGAVRKIIATPSAPPTRMIEEPKTLKSTVLLIPDFDSAGAATMAGAGTGASTGLARALLPRSVSSAGAPSARALRSMMLSE
jgi:hypothetical protein